MKKIHLLPNAITAFGLSCGLFVIFRLTMLEAGEVSYQVLLASAGILLLAALADLFDGAVARLMKAQSEFGGIFDSLSDAITFGVAPTVMTLKSLQPTSAELSYLVTMGAMVFAICGVLRLARYSSTPLTSYLVSVEEEGAQKNFTGLPIPAACMAAISANLLFISPEFRWFIPLKDSWRATIMSLLFLLLGYFMISRWRFPSLKSLQVRVASFQLVFLTVLTVVLVFYGLLHHFAVIFALISWTYLITAWSLSLVRLMGGRHRHILIDYEPEEFPEE